MEFEHLKKQENRVRQAFQEDSTWLRAVSIKGNESDYNEIEWAGYMKEMHSKDPAGTATRYTFGPLVDSPPAHADTVLSSLLYIENFVKQHNTNFVHVVADMQIYKVIMQIKWADCKRWKRLVARPGGMHTLMSFLGCIGQLMKGTGREELLGSAFKGVSNMLNGKAWPKAMRGLRMVVVAFIKNAISEGTTANEIEVYLNRVHAGSLIGRLWVDCLIQPVLIAHLFVRAERQADWFLHLYCLRRMLPYFFVANHNNYAKYITWHLLEVSAGLPEDAQNIFLTAEHVCRHKNGTWNAGFSDQFGEQTYIRYGKAKGGLVGLTLSSEQVAGWVLSHHTRVT